MNNADATREGHPSGNVETGQDETIAYLLVLRGFGAAYSARIKEFLGNTWTLQVDLHYDFDTSVQTLLNTHRFEN